MGPTAHRFAGEAVDTGLVAKNRGLQEERGAALIEYGLVVLLVAVVGLTAIASVGIRTADAYDEVSNALAVGAAGQALTPKEKWEQAKAAYQKAVAAANATYKAELAAAKDAYKAAQQANKSLPKAERKAANQKAKQDYNAAVAAAKNERDAAIAAAKAAKAAAWDEYKASGG